jgi:glutamate-5-semialdehyde dehydrogenase
MNKNVRKMASAVKGAAFAMARSSLKQRNTALRTLIENLHKNKEMIFQANRRDIASARAGGLGEALLERLSLEGRLEEIILDIEKIISL